MKKRILFIVLLISVLTIGSFGAKGNYNQESQKIIGGSDLDWISKVKKVSDGYIATGRTKSSDGDFSSKAYGNTDAFIIKFDNNFNILWQDKLGREMEDTGDDVIETKSGDYIMVGKTRGEELGNFSTPGQPYPYNPKGFIVKYDHDGNRLWDVTDDFDSTAESGNYLNVVETNTGDFIVIGHMFRRIAGRDYDITLSKYDKNGNLLDQKYVGGSESESEGPLTILADGTYELLAASESTDGDINVPHAGKDMRMILIKFDSNLNIKSVENFGDAHALNIFMYSIFPTEDGGYIYSNGGSSPGYRNLGITQKVDKNGNQEWSLPFATYYISEQSDGYLLSGETEPKPDLIDPFNGTAETDAVATKIDKAGNVLWQDVYGSVDEKDSFVYFDQMPDGRYIAVGNTDGKDGDITEPVKGDRDIFVSYLNNIPVINGEAEKDVHVFDKKSDKEIMSLFNIKAHDEEDGDITNEIKVDQSKVDYNTVGTYDVNFYVKDHSGIVGNEDSFDVKLNVINDKPTISSDSEKEVHVFENKTDQELVSLFNVKALDTEEGNLNKSVVVDQSAVDYSTLGTYDISFKITDKLGETAEVKSKVKVVNDPPEITGLDSKEAIRGKVLSDEDLIKELNILAMDYEDGNITKDVIVDQSAVDYTVYGDYEVLFEVSDRLNEKATFKSTLRVKDLTPELTADDYKEIEIGNKLSEEEIKQLFNAQAIDYEDGDITNLIAVNMDEVDFNKAGTYNIIFSVTDSAKNYIEKKVHLKVIDNSVSINKPDNKNDEENNKLIQTGKYYRYMFIVSLIILLTLGIQIKKEI